MVSRAWLTQCNKAYEPQLFVLLGGKMTPEDIEAVADYLCSLNHPYLAIGPWSNSLGLTYM
jgi:hypothetical protein